LIYFINNQCDSIETLFQPEYTNKKRKDSGVKRNACFWLVVFSNGEGSAWIEKNSFGKVSFFSSFLEKQKRALELFFN
jgi:hypothetical protein